MRKSNNKISFSAKFHTISGIGSSNNCIPNVGQFMSAVSCKNYYFSGFIRIVFYILFISALHTLHFFDHFSSLFLLSFVPPVCFSIRRSGVEASKLFYYTLLLSLYMVSVVIKALSSITNMEMFI